MSFEVVSSERFPASFSGVLVPDDGVSIRFRDGIENYYESDDPLVGVFLSEHVTSAEFPFIVSGVQLAKLEALVTFGIHIDADRLGKTHLGIVARELALPFLRLQKPKQYPDHDRAIQNRHTWLQEVHTPGWVQNNPLVPLYHKYVRIELSDNHATVAPFEH